MMTIWISCSSRGFRLKYEDKKWDCDGKHFAEKRGAYFSGMFENNIETRYNKLSNKCNLLKPVQTEEI